MTYPNDPQHAPATGGQPASEGAPLETKVAAGAGGASIGAALAALIVYLLDQLVYTGNSSWGSDVPEMVTAAVFVVISGLGSLIAGYQAPHTRR